MQRTKSWTDEWQGHQSAKVSSMDFDLQQVRQQSPHMQEMQQMQKPTDLLSYKNLTMAYSNIKDTPLTPQKATQKKRRKQRGIRKQQQE